MFACLLFLTGYPQSAQFWWQLAAGAGDRAAAYCLHLHHLTCGHHREACHWLDQAMRNRGDDQSVSDFFTLLKKFARYHGGHAPASVPTERLELEVDRLAAQDQDSYIVSCPDQRLADRFHDCWRSGLTV